MNQLYQYSAAGRDCQAFFEKTFAAGDTGGGYRQCGTCAAVCGGGRVPCGTQAGRGAARAQKGESGGGATGSAKLFVRRLLCWGCRAGMAARGRRYPMKRPMRQKVQTVLALAALLLAAVCLGWAALAGLRAAAGAVSGAVLAAVLPAV